MTLCLLFTASVGVAVWNDLVPFVHCFRGSSLHVPVCQCPRYCFKCAFGMCVILCADDCGAFCLAPPCWRALAQRLAGIWQVTLPISARVEWLQPPTTAHHALFVKGVD